MIAFQEEIQQAAQTETWTGWDPIYASTFEKVAMIKGREEGLQTGRQEGEAALLAKQLKLVAGRWKLYCRFQHEWASF